MAIISLDIGMFLREDIRRLDVGREIFSTMERQCPWLMPERIGNFEPVRNPFPPTAWIEVLQGAWQNPVLWTRKKPRVRGMLMFPALRDPAALFLRVWVQLDHVPGLVAWFSEVATRLSCEYGYIHTVAPQERAYLQERGMLGHVDRAGKDVFVLSGYPDLERDGVSALFWANVFGPKYLTPQVKTAASLAFESRELGPGMQYVQLTRSPLDVHDKHAEFAMLRQQIADRILPIRVSAH